MRCAGATTLGAFLLTLSLVMAPAPAFPESGQGVETVVVRLLSHVTESQIVPEAEEQLLEMLNQARHEHHLPSLAIGGSLRSVARSHSRDMALGGYVGHGSFLEQSFIERLSGAVRPGTLVGENVTMAATVELAHSAFMNSRGHLENILRPAFHRVGIGIATAGPPPPAIAAAGIGTVTAGPLLIVTEDFAE